VPNHKLKILLIIWHIHAKATQVLWHESFWSCSYNSFKLPICCTQRIFIYFSFFLYFFLLLPIAILIGPSPTFLQHWAHPQNRTIEVLPSAHLCSLFIFIYIYICKFNFGQSIWDKSVVLWEHLEKTLWELEEPFENTMGTPKKQYIPMTLCVTSLWISICSTFGNPMFPTFSIAYIYDVPTIPQTSGCMQIIYFPTKGGWFQSSQCISHNQHGFLTT
jgi:hypothetical protein